MLASVGEIVDFEMFPFGNAKETKLLGKFHFTCQHGKNECIGNMYQACAFNLNTNVTDWWPFVLCMEKSETPVTAAEGCATDTKLDWSAIQTCAGDEPDQGAPEQGNAFMHKIANATNSLIPAHQFTPWVVLNGKPLSSKKLDKSLTSLVCDAYTGTKPTGCTKFQFSAYTRPAL